MELLTAAFVTGTLLISFEGLEADLALIAGAIAIVAYKTGGPGGVAETVKGMGSFGAVIFSPCLIVLSWRATRKWLPSVWKRPTAQHEAERQQEAARQRQLPVTGERDLRAGIAALFDMLADQPVEMLERPLRQPETLRVV